MPPAIQHVQRQYVVTHAEIERMRVTPPVYLGFCQVETWADKPRSRVITLNLVDVGDAVRHPFAGLSWSAKQGEGQRLRMSLQRTEGHEPGHGELVYYGEASLSWWAEDPAHGMWIRAYLDVAVDSPRTLDDAHPLRGVRDRLSNPRDAEMLQLSCWALGDDELVVAHKPRGPKVPFVAMDATHQAGIKCSDPQFRMWCSEVAMAAMPPEQVAALPSFSQNPGEFAAEIIRIYCRVASRADLKRAGVQGEQARARWLDMLRQFGLWRVEQARITQP